MHHNTNFLGDKRDADHVKWSKATDDLLNGSWGAIVFVSSSDVLNAPRFHGLMSDLHVRTSVSSVPPTSFMWSWNRERLPETPRLQTAWRRGCWLSTSPEGGDVILSVCLRSQRWPPDTAHESCLSTTRLLWKEPEINVCDERLVKLWNKYWSLLFLLEVNGRSVSFCLLTDKSILNFNLCPTVWTLLHSPFMNLFVQNPLRTDWNVAALWSDVKCSRRHLYTSHNATVH